MEIVASGLYCELSKLNSSERIVVLRGTNNIDQEIRFNVKQCIQDFAIKTKQTNILCTIPLMYDSPELNGTIRKYNIEFVIEAIKYNHIISVSLSNIPAYRFTPHCLHLNRRGKRALCHFIDDQITNSGLK